jgi:hypothetical protein
MAQALAPVTMANVRMYISITFRTNYHIETKSAHYRSRGLLIESGPYATERGHPAQD